MAAAPARIPYRGCPLCGAAESAEVMVADCSAHELYRPGLPARQRWLRCERCGHLHVDGYFNAEALALLFSVAQESQTPGYDVENQRVVWSRVLDAVGALRDRLDGRWLDVGFGSGALLTTAAEYGYDVVGIDARAASVERLRRFGVEAHACDFLEFRAAEPFDVISMADVLEHMPFPGEALRHAHRLLAPDGLLFLSMPNAEAFVFDALTQHGMNPYWAEIEHYHNFGRGRLFALLEECRFRPLRYGVSTRYRACMEVIARRAAG